LQLIAKALVPTTNRILPAEIGVLLNKLRPRNCLPVADDDRAFAAVKGK